MLEREQNFQQLRQYGRGFWRINSQEINLEATEICFYQKLLRIQCTGHHRYKEISWKIEIETQILPVRKIQLNLHFHLMGKENAFVESTTLCRKVD